MYYILQKYFSFSKPQEFGEIFIMQSFTFLMITGKCRPKLFGELNHAKWVIG